MRDQHRDVMVKYYNVVDETTAVLRKLTQKATTLEKLKAKIGECDSRFIHLTASQKQLLKCFQFMLAGTASISTTCISIAFS